jgi:hypothetical protein
MAVENDMNAKIHIFVISISVQGSGDSRFEASFRPFLGPLHADRGASGELADFKIISVSDIAHDPRPCYLLRNVIYFINEVL